MKKLERVIIVDDDQDFNVYHDIMLKEMEIHKDSVLFQSGEEALNYIAKAEEHIDLILLDLNMPLMNGWQFAKRYEKIIPKRNAPIIMLTSSVDYDDELKAKEYTSIKKFMNKPLTPKYVHQILTILK